MCQAFKFLIFRFDFPSGAEMRTAPIRQSLSRRLAQGWPPREIPRGGYVMLQATAADTRQSSLVMEQSAHVVKQSQLDAAQIRLVAKQFRSECSQTPFATRQRQLHLEQCGFDVAHCELMLRFGRTTLRKTNETWSIGSSTSNIGPSMGSKTSVM